MEINLWEIDVPVSLFIDVTASGKTYVAIKPADHEEPVIGLDAVQCREWARVLNFLADEIEHERIQ